jgi:hypothetical protein
MKIRKVTDDYTFRREKSDEEILPECGHVPEYGRRVCFSYAPNWYGTMSLHITECLKTGLLNKYSAS